MSEQPKDAADKIAEGFRLIASPDPGENWSGPDPRDVGEERLALGIRELAEYLKAQR